MKKSLYASAAVLALILASPAVAQPTDKDDENSRPRAGHVSHDNEPPRGEKPAQPAPNSTVAPSGAMGGERGTREKPANSTGTMAPSNTMAPSGTMGRTGTRHHERGTNAMMPSTRTNTGTRTTTAPRAGTTAVGRGAHVHNPTFDRMRRVTTATQRFHFGTYVRPSGWYAHRWTFGEFLPAFFFARTYWILNFSGFGLDEPPPGTVWVRVGDDALLIDEYTGEVIEVVYGIFY